MSDNNTDVTWNTNVFGMENRFVAALKSYHLDFTRPAAANFPSDFVSVVDPFRGYYGLLTTQRQTATIDSVAINLEDRLKITQNFALIGGLRYNPFQLDRTSADVSGISKAGFPYSASWQPVTGRIGYTWEAIPGMTFYSQYATASDLSADSIFLLEPDAAADLTSAELRDRRQEPAVERPRRMDLFGVRHRAQQCVLGTGRSEPSICRRKLKSQGVEFAAAVRPPPSSSSGATSPTSMRAMPTMISQADRSPAIRRRTYRRVVVNAGASYRFVNPGWLPVELGVVVRHVGDRYSTDANTVKLLAYTTADAFAFIDIPKSRAFPTFYSTRVTFRVRNLTNRRYAEWSDQFYPDQIFLGAPRTYEIETSFKF